MCMKRTHEKRLLRYFQELLIERRQRALRSAHRRAHGGGRESTAAVARSTEAAPRLSIMCSDVPAPPPLSCSKVGGAAVLLCRGVAKIRSSSCASLLEIEHVKGIIEEIGLVPDHRGAWLYGSASRFQVNASGWGATRVGLWQDPLQISAALVHLARHSGGSLIPHIRTYVEVGVFSAWTCVVISSFLARILPPSAGPFRAAAVDIDRSHIAFGTGTLLAQHNVTFVHRGGLHRWLDSYAPPAGRTRIGLCFIDGTHDCGGTFSRPRPTFCHEPLLFCALAGQLRARKKDLRSPSDPSSPTSAVGARPLSYMCMHMCMHLCSFVFACVICPGNHSYAAARADYESLAPRCRAVMLHDVQDHTTLTLHQHADGGGVPGLWQQIRSAVTRERVAAFTEQHSTTPAGMFGIGSAFATLVFAFWERIPRSPLPCPVLPTCMCMHMRIHGL